MSTTHALNGHTITVRVHDGATPAESLALFQAVCQAADQASGPTWPGATVTMSRRADDPLGPDAHRSWGRKPDPQVIITPDCEDEADPDWYANVLMVCPYDECGAVDDIREVDTSSRWNDVRFDTDPGTELRDGLTIAIGSNGEYHAVGFICATCGRPVELPADLLEEASYA
jgi:hypothetical protein